MSKIALAIHGGAGTILRSSMTPELEREYRDGLENAIAVGWKILSGGGSALDCVEATVCELENFPLFNAGRGSVFTHAGKNEMDASIMDGKTLDAGTIAFVRNVKHPIKLARLVLLPEPVGPVTRNSPRGRLTNSMQGHGRPSCSIDMN